VTKADIHPEHVYPDYQEIEDRLAELGITRLSDDIGIGYDERSGSGVLYTNLHAYTPHRAMILTDYEMWKLVNYWLDGHCPCGEQIPGAHYLCRTCLDEANAAWGRR
jgi:hypothetical protein